MNTRQINKEITRAIDETIDDLEELEGRGHTCPLLFSNLCERFGLADHLIVSAIVREYQNFLESIYIGFSSKNTLRAVFPNSSTEELKAIRIKLLKEFRKQYEV